MKSSLHPRLNSPVTQAHCAAFTFMSAGACTQKHESYFSLNALPAGLRLKRTFTGLGFALLCPLVWANAGLIGTGFSMTTGFVNNPHNLHSVNFNPAGADFLVPKDKTIRMGLLGNWSGQYEFGDANQIKDSMDKLNTITKKIYYNPVDLIADIDSLQSEVLPSLENGGQLSTGTNFSSPALPVVWRSEQLKGTLYFGLDFETQFSGKFKTATIKPNNTFTGIETNSGFDLRVVQLIHPTVGYASQPFEELKDVKERFGRVDVGGRLHLYSAVTMRDYKLVSSNIVDNLNFPSASSFDWGIDLGIMNTYTNYQFGATVYNLNSPKLKFPDLANNAAANAQASIGKISLNGESTLIAHTVLEASVFDESKSFILQGSHALNATTNLVGDECQYTTLSAGFYPRFSNSILNFITPQFRIGFRKNNVGSQLNTMSYGLSMFNGLNLDFWRSNQSYEDTNGKIPRNMGISLGWVTTF